MNDVKEWLRKRQPDRFIVNPSQLTDIRDEFENAFRPIEPMSTKSRKSEIVEVEGKRCRMFMKTFIEEPIVLQDHQLEPDMFEKWFKRRFRTWLDKNKDEETGELKYKVDTKIVLPNTEEVDVYAGVKCRPSETHADIETTKKEMENAVKYEVQKELEKRYYNDN